MIKLVVNGHIPFIELIYFNFQSIFLSVHFIELDHD